MVAEAETSYIMLRFEICFSLFLNGKDIEIVLKIQLWEENMLNILHLKKDNCSAVEVSRDIVLY